MRQHSALIATRELRELDTAVFAEMSAIQHFAESYGLRRRPSSILTFRVEDGTG